MNYPIIVGTDLTEASDDALIQAEGRASREGVPLTVVHVMSPWGVANDIDHVDRLRALVVQQVTALTGRSHGEYDIVIERGLVHTVLARLAVSQQALLVIGSHMHQGVGHALLRDVAERVVERARVPVLVSRPRSGSARILVAVDWPFSKSTALDVAIDEARSSDSKLSVLHRVNTSFLQVLAADIINGGAYAERPLGQSSQVVEARRALRAELQLRHVDPALYVVEGEASSLISQFASRTDAELVVVGTAHRPAPTPHVTTAVLRHAQCSALVVDDTSVLPSADSTVQKSSKGRTLENRRDHD
jgi:nucleotide-binding universal stress UspA family protein